MKLIVKNMVSIRCKMIVKAVMEALGLTYCSVELGEVQTKENISDEQRDRLKTSLLKYGLELLDDRKAILGKNTFNEDSKFQRFIRTDVPKLWCVINSSGRYIIPPTEARIAF